MLAQSEAQPGTLMSDDEIEEMVRDAICMCAVEKETREAALRWLDQRVLCFLAMQKFMRLTSRDDDEAAAR
jgi:hypothetical protein